MTDAAREILEKVQRLSPVEQEQLLVELQRVVHRTDVDLNGRSILELEGLGRDLWNGIDAQEYVRRERNSWNG
jgi:hypothetical protein